MLGVVAVAMVGDHLSSFMEVVVVIGIVVVALMGIVVVVREVVCMCHR